MRTRSAASTLTALAVLALPGVGVAHAQVEAEAQVATSIADRMPQGTGTQFPASTGELFVWMRITGAGSTTVQHVWMHDGMEFPVSLAIGGSPWRTWSSKIIPPEWAGAWSVEVRAADGTVLQTLNFTVG